MALRGLPIWASALLLIVIMLGATALSTAGQAAAGAASSSSGAATSMPSSGTPAAYSSPALGPVAPSPSFVQNTGNFCSTAGACTTTITMSNAGDALLFEVATSEGCGAVPYVVTSPALSASVNDTATAQSNAGIGGNGGTVAASVFCSWTWVYFNVPSGLVTLNFQTAPCVVSPGSYPQGCPMGAGSYDYETYAVEIHGTTRIDPGSNGAVTASPSSGVGSTSFVEYYNTSVSNDLLYSTLSPLRCGVSYTPPGSWTKLTPITEVNNCGGIGGGAPTYLSGVSATSGGSANFALGSPVGGAGQIIAFAGTLGPGPVSPYFGNVTVESPGYLLYDPNNGLVYVSSNSTSNGGGPGVRGGGISYIPANAANPTVTGGIGLGYNTNGFEIDLGNSTLTAQQYGTGTCAKVAQGSSGYCNNGTLISTVTNKVVKPFVRLGQDPRGGVWDAKNGYTYVDNDIDANVSVVNAGTLTTIGTGVAATGAPAQACYDSGNGDVYVTTYSGGEMYVYGPSGASGYGKIGSFSSSDPFGCGYDPQNGLLYVEGYGVSDVTVYNVTSSATAPPTVKTITMPSSEPRYATYANGYMFIGYAGYDYISVIYGWTNTLVGELGFNSATSAYSTFDPTTNDLWAEGLVANNVTVINQQMFPVTLASSGLPSGTIWSATADSVTNSSTAFHPGTSIFYLPNGTYTFTATTTAAYLSHGGTIVVNGAAVTVTAAFVPEYPISLIPSGLPAGKSWSAVIGGTTNTTTTPGINSVLQVNGSYAYSVTTVPGWVANPSSGTVSVNGPIAPIPISFTLNGWTNATTAVGPSARYGAAMTYDYADGYYLLFGGHAAGTNTQSGAILGDTWAYSNGVWTNMTHAGPPSSVVPGGGTACQQVSGATGTGLFGASMAYDPAVGYTVLFGGACQYYTGSGFPSTSNTYEYLAGKWTLLSTTVPSGTFYSAWNSSMAYDPALHELIMVEGQTIGSGSGFNYHMATWAFTNNSGVPTWTLITTTVPGTARAGATLAYDPSSGDMVLFGGYSGSSFTSVTTYSSTYLFSPTTQTWSAASPSTVPTARFGAQSVNDTALNGVLLFGGATAADNPADALGDVWLWSNGNWYNETATYNTPGIRLGMGFGGYNRVVGGQSVLTAVSFGGCRAAGSPGKGCPRNDTWALNPAQAYGFTTSESGLPSGAVWYANVTGRVPASANSGTALIQDLPNGTYTVSLATNWKNYSTTVTRTAIVTGGAALLAVSFALFARYTVTASETGLPGGTSWAIVVNGRLAGSSTSSIALPSLANGTYAYSVSGAAGYLPTVSSGNLAVKGATSLSVTFSLAAYALTFSEVGLASGTSWAVTVNGAVTRATTSTISFSEAPGTYAWNLSYVAGYQATLAHGSVTVGTYAINVPITFSARTYAVTFTQRNLTGNWAVQLGSTLLSNSTGGPITFLEANNTAGYAFSVAAYPGWTPTANASGTAKVTGAALGILVPFSPTPASTYSLMFTESGLPAGTSWSVTVASTTNTTAAPGRNVYTGMVAGSYTYSVGAIAGYNAPTLSCSSPVTVLTASVSCGVLFSPTTYVVTFNESGLVGGYWSVTFRGVVGFAAAGSNVTFSAPTGSGYLYTVASQQISGTPAYYAPSPASGTITVASSGVVQHVTFTYVPAHASARSATPAALPILWVVGAVAGCLVLRRKSPQA